MSVRIRKTEVDLDLMVIKCGRGAVKKCAYCEEPQQHLCDYTLVGGSTCDTPMCARHAWWPGNGKEDFCRTHRRIIEGKDRDAKHLAELEAKKRDTLIHFDRSKYPGKCRDKDCGATWEAGDPMWWDRETKEVFCNDCGDLMSGA
jgi:hypothetical protein